MKIQNAVIITTDHPIEMSHEEMQRGDMEGCIIFERTALPDEVLRWLDQAIRATPRE